MSKIESHKKPTDQREGALCDARASCHGCQGGRGESIQIEEEHKEGGCTGTKELAKEVGG